MVGTSMVSSKFLDLGRYFLRMKKITIIYVTKTLEIIKETILYPNLYKQ
jgi:hypothetical protein